VHLRDRLTILISALLTSLLRSKNLAERPLSLDHAVAQFFVKWTGFFANDVRAKTDNAATLLSSPKLGFFDEQTTHAHAAVVHIHYKALYLGVPICNHEGADGHLDPTDNITFPSFGNPDSTAPVR